MLRGFFDQCKKGFRFDVLQGLLLFPEFWLINIKVSLKVHFWHVFLNGVSIVSRQTVKCILASLSEGIMFTCSSC